MTPAAAIRAQLAAGEVDEALAHARAALSEEPGDPTLHALHGAALVRAGRRRDAARAFEQALRLDPDHLDARYDLALLLLRARPAVAAGLLGAVAAARPADVDARLNLGAALARAGRWTAALPPLVEATQIAPHRGDAWLARATAEASCARHGEAAPSFARALACDPLQGRWWLRAGWHALTCGDLALARARFERAALLRGDDLEVAAGLAQVDEREGRPEAGLTRLGPHLEAVPRSPRAAESLARCARRLGQADAALPVVQVARSGARDPGDRRRLDYALGSLHDAKGDGEAALACWLRAGAAAPFRDAPAAHEAQVDAVVQLHTRDALRPGRDRCPGPVLIVGLPRTGTSLLEQMLDRHSRITGCGELQAGVKMAEGLGPNWAAALPTLDDDALDRLAAHWRSAARADTPLVTDKLPLNDLHLGVFTRALPGTRVLWCLRDPRDVAVSCLAQAFSGPRYAWATSLAGIARRVQAHHRLLEHWRGALPLPVHLVRYEDLVGDPETTIGRVLAFLELDPEPATLAPHRSTRRLNTASYAQIQEPIHRRSVGRWRRCARGLQPLLDALGPLAEPEAWPAQV